VSDIAQGLGTRLGRVAIAPTLAGAIAILLVVWSGAPGHLPSIDRLETNADAFSANDWALLSLAILLVALATQPLQLGLVRLLEGYAPGPFRAAMERQRGRHVERAKGLDEIERDKSRRIDERIRAGRRRRDEYPPEERRILPTALGNALRAAEDTAGEHYGLATVATWPLLYLLLPERSAAVVDDARNQLDSSCRYCVVLAVVTPIAAGLLVPQGPAVLIALAPAVLAWLSYRSALAAAVAYGRTLQTMYDLHRFELYTALRVPLPADEDAERTQNTAISMWLGQRVRPGFIYRGS
jgi:hypothetical protein